MFSSLLEFLFLFLLFVVNVYVTIMCTFSFIVNECCIIVGCLMLVLCYLPRDCG